MSKEANVCKRPLLLRRIVGMLLAADARTLLTPSDAESTESKHRRRYCTAMNFWGNVRVSTTTMAQR